MTCSTCKHYHQAPWPPSAPDGRCDLVLPPWLVGLLYRLGPDEYYRKETDGTDTCSFHTPKEPT